LAIADFDILGLYKTTRLYILRKIIKSKKINYFEVAGDL